MISDLTLDGEGTLWAGAQSLPSLSSPYGGRLLRFNGVDWTALPLSMSHAVFSVEADAWGRIWYSACDQKEAMFACYIAHVTPAADTLLQDMADVLVSLVAGPDSTVWTMLPRVQEDGYRYGSSELARFDGEYWTTFPSVSADEVLAVGRHDRVWLRGAEGDLVLFNGSSWHTYHSTDTPLPFGHVWAAALEEDTLWVGTDKGLLRFDGSEWTAYTQTNSGLPNDDVRSVAVDRYGNKWIATFGGGIAVFQEGGPVSVGAATLPSQSERIELRVYPNPFFHKAVVRYELASSAHVTLSVVDVLGREVIAIENSRREMGVHEATLDGRALASGLYFVRMQADGFTRVVGIVRR